MSEQIDTQTTIVQDMPILVEREKLRIRIRNNIIKLLLCDLNKLPCTVILELKQDLKEWFQDSSQEDTQ